MMSNDLQTTVNKVLKPYNLHLTDLEVPRFADLGVIVGNDNAAIQIEDNIHLNKRFFYAVFDVISFYY